MKNADWFFRVASGTAAGLIAATILAAIMPLFLFDRVVYNAVLTVNVIMTIAIILTAFFAAWNLKHLQEIAAAEYNPELTVEALLEASGNESHFLVTVANVGQGHAIDVEARIWTRLHPAENWFALRIPQVPRHLPPGQSIECRFPVDDRLLHSWSIYGPARPSIVTEALYRDVLPRSRRSPPRSTPPESYDLQWSTAGNYGLVGSNTPAPDFEKACEDRRRHLKKVIEKHAKRLSYGLSIEHRITPYELTVDIVRPGEDVYWSLDEDPGTSIPRVESALEAGITRAMSQFTSDLSQ
jgi:hypothetical protein